MPQKMKRNPIFRANRFQKRIIYPVLLASCFACLIAIMCMVYFFLLQDEKPLVIREYYENGALLSQQFFRDEGPISRWTAKIYAFDLSDFRKFIPLFTAAIVLLLIFVIYGTLYITSKVIGPVERVIYELDEVLSGRKSTPIVIRRGDEMFDEILKRINALIKRNLPG